MDKTPLLPRIIGTGFGAGYWPWGPGTAGSLMGVLIWAVLGLLLEASTLRLVMLALIVLFTLLGTWATSKLIPFWGDDPSRVVIDEIVGMWIPLSLFSPDGELEILIPVVLAAFAFFRFFDIVKPLGIRALDRKKGAFWVMADDILAGIYSIIAIITLLVLFVILWAD